MLVYINMVYWYILAFKVCTSNKPNNVGGSTS